MDRVVYTPQDLAKRWSVSESTISRMLTTGQLRGFQCGNRWRIAESAVDEYEQAQVAS